MDNKNETERSKQAYFRASSRKLSIVLFARFNSAKQLIVYHKSREDSLDILDMFSPCNLFRTEMRDWNWLAHTGQKS